MIDFLIFAAIWLAIGVLSVWCAYSSLKPEKWWGWLILVVAWPAFWWRFFRR